MKKRAISRRQFVQEAGAYSLAAAISSSLSFLPLALGNRERPRRNRVSWLAYRSTQEEGLFAPRLVEGMIPPALKGNLYRIGPGAKEAGSTDLKHFFDGDALLTKFTFQDGAVFGNSRFVETKERREEKAQGKMLYLEFGTGMNRAKGYKNSPNIHVHFMGGKLLTLSESAAPVAVNPQSLETEGAWNFSGTLADRHTFTAHPKRDPNDGTYYTYGITQGISPQLKTYRVKADGRLEFIKGFGMGGFYLVHDMTVTENYIIYAVPAVYVDLMGAVSQTKPIAELLRFEEKGALRIFVLRKDGQGKVMEFRSEAGGMAFHNCNAYEEEGKIILDSILTEDFSIFKLLQNWDSLSLPAVPASKITRFELDLGTQKVLTREVKSDGRPTDFPCIDPMLAGKKGATYYCLEAQLGTDDPLAMNALVAWNSNSFSYKRVTFPNSCMLGEAVFSRDQEGNPWLIHLGYEAGADETFLDIRKPDDLSLQARVWLGRYLPLGFHGSFIE